ncbi:unnamed protein product [Coffea canephora]|uniref:DH200=94 genomic scaffold, scaffold_8017 n=1 Tax=Coffea canephora TaxID=49390 RepID=A0A068VMV2_COFCA|nr:unnamed protein product [Coffea canephora]
MHNKYYIRPLVRSLLVSQSCVFLLQIYQWLPAAHQYLQQLAWYSSTPQKQKLSSHQQQPGSWSWVRGY